MAMTLKINFGFNKELNMGKIKSNKIFVHILCLLLIGVFCVVGVVIYGIVKISEPDNVIQKEVASPDDKIRAVSFLQYHGAIGPTVLVISLLPKGEQFTDSLRCQVIAATYVEKIDMEWLNAKHLLIKIRCGRIFLQRDKMREINITYDIEMLPDF